MKRYQLLIKQGAADKGMSVFGRLVGIPKQSLSNYLLDGTEPRNANLDKIAKYFGEPVASLIIDVGEEGSVDSLILDRLSSLTKAKKQKVLEFMRSL